MLINVKWIWKYIINYIAIVMLLLLSGCSSKNAFSNFTMNDKQMLLASNTQSAKIESQSYSNGKMSVIYLNNVDKKITKGEEKFFVSIYIKEKKNDFLFKLNNENPIVKEEMYRENYYANLLEDNKSWHKYYMVSFKAKEKKMNFSLHDKNGKKISEVSFQRY